MPKGTTFASDLLKLIFNATTIANIAEDASVGPLTELYISLHTADPGAGGTQQTSETTYTDYDRVAVTRDNTGWTISSNSVSPAANIDFPACSGGTATITHVGIGTASSGAGKLLYAGAITPNISVSTGVQPRLTTGSAITET